MMASRRFFAFTAATLALGHFGCAGVGSSIGMSFDAGDLKKTVAFETRCPEADIRVLESMEAGIGHSKFRLSVCGQEQRWERLGTSYFAEGRSPMDGHLGQGGLGSRASEVAPAPAPAPAPSAVPAASAPVASEVTQAAPSGHPAEAVGVTREEYDALLRRIVDLEFRAAGKKSNAQLISELSNERDDAWQLRLTAAKLLGERKAVEARPALEKAVSSPKSSEALRKSANAALEQLGSAHE